MKPTRIWLGLLFLALGVSGILDAIGTLAWNDTVGRWWPVAIITFGLADMATEPKARAPSCRPGGIRCRTHHDHGPLRPCWGWPLLDSFRVGIVALAVVGVPMCLIGGYSFWDSPAFRHPVLIFKDMFLTVAAALGFVALVLIVVGLIAGTQAPFVGLAAVMGSLWIVATLRHAVEGRSGIDVHGAVGVS